MLHRWLEFLSGAENWAEVPVPLKDSVMEEAMGVLQPFQQNQTWNDTYRCRLDGLRRHKTQQVALEEAKAELQRTKAKVEQAQVKAEQAQARADRERVEKERAQAQAEQAQAEIQQLRERLAQALSEPKS